MKKSELLLLIVFTAISVNAQTTTGFHAPWVSCFNSAGRFTGPRLQRTSPIASPNRKLHAYAEISAATDRHADCANTVRLFVSSASQPYGLVFSQTPSLIDGTADSLGPVAWSPNNRWLAVEFGYWFYASDNASQGLLLYDSQTRTIQRPNVIGIIEGALGKECSLQLRSVAGFDRQNRVILSIEDRPDEEGHSSHCTHGTGDEREAWRYDPVTGVTAPFRQNPATITK